LLAFGLHAFLDEKDYGEYQNKLDEKVFIHWLLHASGDIADNLLSFRYCQSLRESQHAIFPALGFAFVSEQALKIPQ